MFRDSVTCTLGLIRTRWTVTMAQHQPLCNANGIEWLTLDSYSAPLMVDARLRSSLCQSEMLRPYLVYRTTRKTETSFETAEAIDRPGTHTNTQDKLTTVSNIPAAQIPGDSCPFIKKSFTKASTVISTDSILVETHSCS